MRRLFLALLLVVSAVVNAQTPLAPPAFFAAPGAQTPLASASDGSQFFVIWSDSRPAAGLYGARVASDGTVVDGAGIPIAYGAISRASVIWDGQQYAIFWDDAAGIRVRHMQPNGTLDPAATVIAGGHTSTNRFVARAANGTFAIVHDSSISFTETTGTAVLTTQPISNAALMSVASVGVDFFALWTDNLQTLGQHFSTDGTIRTDPFTVSATAADAGAPVVVGGSSSYLVLISNPAGTVDVRLVPVSGAVGPPFILGTGSSPAAVAVPNGFAITWVNNGGVVSMFFTNNTTTPATVVAGSGLSPQIAWNGSDIFVAWGDRTSIRDVNGTILGRVAPFRISSATTDQTQPAIAFGDGIYGVVRTETDASSRQHVIFSHVSAAGVPLDGGGTQIDRDDTATNPVMTFDGTNFVTAYLVTNSGAQSIAVNVISPVVAAFDARTEQHIADNVCSTPTLASDSRGAVLAYVDCGSGTVILRRVTGPDAGRSVQVSIPGGHPTRPQVVANGNQFLVAWQLDPLVFAARVSSSLQVLDTTPIPVVASGQNISAGVSGNGFVVAWEATNFVWVRHISAAGNLTSSPIALAAGTSPHVVTDRDQYAITYLRDGTAYLSHEISDERPLVPGATDVAYLTSAAGQATVFTTIRRDLTYGGVNRAFIVVNDTAPARHRAVRK